MLFICVSVGDSWTGPLFSVLYPQCFMLKCHNMRGFISKQRQRSDVTVKRNPGSYPASYLHFLDSCLLSLLLVWPQRNLQIHINGCRWVCGSQVDMETTLSPDVLRAFNTPQQHVILKKKIKKLLSFKGLREPLSLVSSLVSCDVELISLTSVTLQQSSSLFHPLCCCVSPPACPPPSLFLFLLLYFTVPTLPVFYFFAFQMFLKPTFCWKVS